MVIIDGILKEKRGPYFLLIKQNSGLIKPGNQYRRQITMILLGVGWGDADRLKRNEIVKHGGHGRTQHSYPTIMGAIFCKGMSYV